MPNPKKLGEPVKIEAEARTWLAVYDLLELSLSDPRLKGLWAHHGARVQRAIAAGLSMAQVATAEEMSRRSTAVWRTRTTDTIH